MSLSGAGVGSAQGGFTDDARGSGGGGGVFGMNTYDVSAVMGTSNFGDTISAVLTSGKGKSTEVPYNPSKIKFQGDLFLRDGGALHSVESEIVETGNESQMQNAYIRNMFADNNRLSKIALALISMNTITSEISHEIWKELLSFVNMPKLEEEAGDDEATTSRKNAYNNAIDRYAGIVEDYKTFMSSKNNEILSTPSKLSVPKSTKMTNGQYRYIPDPVPLTAAKEKSRATKREETVAKLLTRDPNTNTIMYMKVFDDVEKHMGPQATDRYIRAVLAQENPFEHYMQLANMEEGGGDLSEDDIVFIRIFTGIDSPFGASARMSDVEDKWNDIKSKRDKSAGISAEPVAELVASVIIPLLLALDGSGNNAFDVINRSTDADTGDDMTYTHIYGSRMTQEDDADVAFIASNDGIEEQGINDPSPFYYATDPFDLPAGERFDYFKRCAEVYARRFIEKVKKTLFVIFGFDSNLFDPLVLNYINKKPSELAEYYHSFNKYDQTTNTRSTLPCISQYAFTMFNIPINKVKWPYANMSHYAISTLLETFPKTVDRVCKDVLISHIQSLQHRESSNERMMHPATLMWFIIRVSGFHAFMNPEITGAVSIMSSDYKHARAYHDSRGQAYINISDSMKGALKPTAPKYETNSDAVNFIAAITAATEIVSLKTKSEYHNKLRSTDTKTDFGKAAEIVGFVLTITPNVSTKAYSMVIKKLTPVITKSNGAFIVAVPDGEPVYYCNVIQYALSMYLGMSIGKVSFDALLNAMKSTDTDSRFVGLINAVIPATLYYAKTFASWASNMTIEAAPSMASGSATASSSTTVQSNAYNNFQEPARIQGGEDEVDPSLYEDDSSEE
tara:strand:- start:4627 stop:7170 length:2544 start_codon:yes stop_codon:yes gene_type:complete